MGEPGSACEAARLVALAPLGSVCGPGGAQGALARTAPAILVAGRQGIARYQRCVDCVRLGAGTIFPPVDVVAAAFSDTASVELPDGGAGAGQWRRGGGGEGPVTR